MIADLTREFVSDVVGQYIYYYPVSSLKTLIDDVYNEAVERIFERPIKINVMADQNKRENTVGEFAAFQKKSTIEIHLHLRDLQTRNIVMFIGDFFVYGDEVYEIMDIYETNNIFGQEEYKYELMLIGNMVGNSQMELVTLKQKLLNGRTYKDNNPQVPFVQQRGLEETQEGITKDVREVREQLGDELAEIALGEGPRVVRPTPDGLRNDIYDD